MDADFRVKGYGYRVKNAGLGTKGLRFRDTDEGFIIPDYGCKV